jgi:hypothetical protein
MRIMAALKIDEYVPDRIPMNRMIEKCRIVTPPNIESASKVNITVKDVFNDRLNVWTIE